MTNALAKARFAVPLLFAACCAGPADAQPAAFGGPKMLIHGNYCGPGNNAPLPPIDALDAACARHDACTPSGRLPSEACNLRLEREADLISQDPRQPADVRAMAGIIAAGATAIPSDPRSHGFAAGPTAGLRAPAPYAVNSADVDSDDPDDE